MALFNCGMLCELRGDLVFLSFCSFFYHPATTEIYTLSLHDALPISTSAPWSRSCSVRCPMLRIISAGGWTRSEEHTSELQSPCNLVCRLLLEKKKNV